MKFRFEENAAFENNLQPPKVEIAYSITQFVKQFFCFHNFIVFKINVKQT